MEASASTKSSVNSDTTTRQGEIRPFNVEIPQEQLDDLRRRVAATNWPEKETVADQSQGVPLAITQELARYWATDYDWSKCEDKLKALPHFTTEIDGLDIHFIHLRSKHEDALPVVINHGWPGSIIEQLKIIEPLTDPTAHGASASDAFDVVIPSMPGYGFSGKPTETGWGPEHMARAWAELMTDSATTATSLRAATGAPSSSIGWACRRLGDSYAFRTLSRLLPADVYEGWSPVARRHSVSRLRKGAPMSSSTKRCSKKSPMPSTWRRARKPCTE